MRNIRIILLLQLMKAGTTDIRTNIFLEFFFFAFLRAVPVHSEVPRLGVE